MTVPAVPSQAPGQSQLNLPDIANPYMSVWWTSQTASGVPENVMGWLVAQGWEITGVTWDNTTTPATARYALSKQGMQPWQVLLSLCNSYTIAANDARWANETRYNQIVANWTEMISSSQTHFDNQITEQNTQAGVYLADLDTYMDAIDTLISDNSTQIVADAATATTALEAMDTKLADLETNAAANAVTIGNLLTSQSNYLSTFLTDFAEKLDELDTNYTAHLAHIQALLDSSDTVLSDFTTSESTQTAALSAAYTELEAELDALLATASTNLDNIVTDVGGILTSIASDYAAVDASVDSLLTTGLAATVSFGATCDSIVNFLEDDYNEHADTATAFLTDLGTTETARITEQFAATLSAQLQDLIDRGLYSSAVAADITARNIRDRDDQIQLHNDRINREKWENQHRLYEQQVAMRKNTLDGHDRVHAVRQEVWRYQASQIIGVYGLQQSMRDRTLAGKVNLYQFRDAYDRLSIDVQTRLHEVGQSMRKLLVDEAARLAQLSQSILQWKGDQRGRLMEQLQQIEGQHLAGIDKQHTAQQDVSRIAVSTRDTLLQQLQDAVKGFLAGKERYAASLMQNASTLADHKHKAIAELMNTSVARLEGWKTIADQNRTLMAMQLDERNKLLVGLYSFCERREDEGPSWADMTKTIAGLADSAGGWLAP